MHYVAQRMGFRVPPWLLVPLVVIGAMVGAAFWIGPFKPQPPEVALLAGTQDQWAATVALPNLGSERDPRFPLVLAVVNEGRRAAEPVALHVSVPASFRLRSARYELPRERDPGNPLVRYTLPVTAAVVPPQSGPVVLAALDTVWIEPELADYYCITAADSVPEFVPAPRIDPVRLADLRIFYSVRDGRHDARQTGVLALQLDPAALAREPAASPPIFVTQVRRPWIPQPELGPLSHAGSRTVYCGDPQQPLELFSATWETPQGGRFIVLHVNGAPRKHLFDLNRDSIIEMEAWDGDGDGRFEARRAARYAIPGFLLPERVPEESEALDSLANDPGWQLRFHETALGPFRFLPDSLRPELLHLRAPLDTVPVDSLAMRDTLGRDTLPLRPAAPPVDSVWLRRFNDTTAGPFRFVESPPPRLAEPPPPAPPPAARPRQQEPLGRPIEYPRP